MLASIIRMLKCICSFFCLFILLIAGSIAMVMSTRIKQQLDDFPITAEALRITGIVLLVICTLPCTLGLLSGLAAAATAAAQSGRLEYICGGFCFFLLFIAPSIVMIIMSEGIKQGWYVTEALCRATNEWQCEFYQMATQCKVAPIGAGLVDTNCTAVEHYIPTFSVGGGSISERFSCSRYQIIEPAGVEQCKQMAANLFRTGSTKACHFDEDSDTCYAGAGPHDEATAAALLITGIVLLLICTLLI